MFNRLFRSAPPLQLQVRSRIADAEELAALTKTVSGRGQRGLDTSYTVNLRPGQVTFDQIGLGNVIPQNRLASKQQYIQALANAPLKQGNSFEYEPRPQQSLGSPYYEGKRSIPNYREAVKATKAQYDGLIADSAIEPFTPIGQTNEINYLQGTAMNVADRMAALNHPPSLPRGATGELKGIPGVEMEYGRIDSLPDGMRQQGSFYTPVQLGTGTTELYTTDDLLKLNEQAMDSFSGNGGTRFMTGNDYSGYQVADPADYKGWGENIPFPSTPDTWVNSGTYAPARFTKSEREYTPLISVNSQGKNAPVPQSDEPTSMVIPAWQNGNVSPEYADVQRGVHGSWVGKGVMVPYQPMIPYGPMLRQRPGAPRVPKGYSVDEQGYLQQNNRKIVNFGPQDIVNAMQRKGLARRVPSVDTTEQMMGYVEPRTLRMQTPDSIATQEVMGFSKPSYDVRQTVAENSASVYPGTNVPDAFRNSTNPEMDEALYELNRAQFLGQQPELPLDLSNNARFYRQRPSQVRTPTTERQFGEQENPIYRTRADVANAQKQRYLDLGRDTLATNNQMYSLIEPGQAARERTAAAIERVKGLNLDQGTPQPTEPQPTTGSYSMQVIEDPQNFGAFEKNFATAGKELMLPSAVIGDRTPASFSMDAFIEGRPQPTVQEAVLSPYALSHGSTYKGSDLTAKSSMKANLGGDERLAYMLRADNPPDSIEFGDRTPGYVKYIPQSKNLSNVYRETMTDAYDVRDRIAAQASKLGAAAGIAEKQAARTTYLRNPNDVQIDRNFLNIAPGAMENPNLMTRDDRKAFRMRQDATEMQDRLAYTKDAIRQANDELETIDPSRTQKVMVSITGADGLARQELMDLTIQEQAQLGIELQNQRHGRDINYVPPGYSVSYGEEYPEWEQKHQLSANPRIFGSSAPIVPLQQGQTGWGRAVQLRG